jgi:uncharacterized protein (TIGR03790 family)
MTESKPSWPVQFHRNDAMKRLLMLAWVPGLLLAFCVLRARGQGNEVVVIYNTRLAESRDVAEHYAEVRHVPAEQVLGVDLTDTEVVSREEFRDRLQLPLTKMLTDRKLFTLGEPVPAATTLKPGRAKNGVIQSRIRYAVLCYGLPLRIAEDTDLREEGAGRVQIELRRNGAAVDSELACLPLLAGQMPLTGPIINPFYGSTNAAVFAPTNGLLLVTRLDGPTAAIARELVDKAVKAETDGLLGRAYFDLRGLTNGPYLPGDAQIRGASEICRQLGLETVVDARSGTFPAGFPMSQIALYAGWDDENVSGPFALPTVEFMPGAFAYHLNSFSASTLRSTDRHWAGPLLARGVTATMGCVDEPYLQLTPDMAVFFDDFVYLGFSYGEAAYGCQRFLSWQTAVIGDPLYRPFGRSQLQQQQQNLERSQSKLLEWLQLRAVNYRLVHGAPPVEAIAYLENAPITHESAVLTEKLAELYSQAGRAEDSVKALQQVLKLGPTPQQRIRVTLVLGARLVALGRNQEAYDLYRQFLGQSPDYPDQINIYRHLRELALKLGHPAEAEDFEQQISRLTPPSN